MNLKAYKQKEALTLICCGLVLIMLYLNKSSFFPVIMKSKLDKLESVAGLYLILYAILFFILGGYSFNLCKHGSSIHNQARQILIGIWHNFKYSFQSIGRIKLSKFEWFWLTAFFLIGIVIRFYYSNQLMRSDEGATYYYFVSGSLYRSFIYLEPNNHVLHTLLARLSIFLFGNSPVFLRLPAILSGLICLPLIFVVAQKLIGKRSGFVGFALLAIYPAIVLFDTQARGYSLVNMFTLTGIFLVLSIIKKNSVAKQFLLALNCTLGLFVMPSFLFPAFGLFIFLFVSLCFQSGSCLSNLIKGILPASILTIIFTFILYTPVVLATGGIERIIANDTVLPLAWAEFISQTPGHFQLVLQRNTQGIPDWLILIALIVSVFGGIWLFITRKSKLLLLILAMILSAALIYFIKRSIPFPRTLLFLLPLAFLLFDAGVSSFTIKNRPILHKSLAFLFGISMGFSAIYSLPRNTLRDFNTFGTFEEAKKLSIWLSDKLPGIHGINLNYPTRYTTLYYLLQHNDFEKIHQLSNFEYPNYFVMKKGSIKVTDLTKHKVKKVFEEGDALVYTQTEMLTKNKK